MAQSLLEITVTECRACRDGGDVYGLEINGEDYLKGQGILGKSLRGIG